MVVVASEIRKEKSIVSFYGFDSCCINNRDVRLVVGESSQGG